jgi:zinc transporter
VLHIDEAALLFIVTVAMSSSLPSQAELGLICGYRVFQDQRPEEVTFDRAEYALQSSDAVTWLHFNLSDARIRRWLTSTGLLPDLFKEAMKDLDGNRRIEQTDDGILLVISDFAFEDADPADVNSLWCYAGPHLLITARLHALRSPDVFRQRLRQGARADSGVDLLCQLLDVRNERLQSLALEMGTRLDRIEDDILAGNVKLQREHLGRTRRTCARIRRQFGPERVDFGRFVGRPAAPLAEPDREALQSNIETLGFTIEEVAELYERAKLLQEELGSRLAESTSRNLYTLSVLTAVLLPMTLVTGIFGMNVGGLPGMHEPAAFWRVMFLIVASGAVTLAALLWRRLL